MTAEVTKHSVLPINPCLGDNVEMRMEVKLPDGIAFSASSIVSSANMSASNDDGSNIDVYGTDYTITDVYIENVNEGSCRIVLHFIPWQIGNIELPALDVCSGEDKISVLPPPVNVVSVFPNGALGEEPSPPIGPLLSPYTAHALYALAALAIILLSAVCVLSARWQSIRARCRLAMSEVQERRNARALHKRLSALKTCRADDGVFCTELHQALCAYLGARFGEDFSAFTTEEITAACILRTEGVVSPNVEEAYNVMADVMRRADYVRFASAAMGECERDMLTAAALDALETIE